jgi:hypothetical protein
MSERKTVTSNVHLFGTYEKFTFDDLFERLQTEIIDRPEIDPQTIKFGIEEERYDYTDGSYFYFAMYYDRPETDQEYQTRIDRENNRKVDQEERDRREFERLQKKFGEKA